MAAINANTQIHDKSVDRAAMIRLYERRVNGKVELIIDGHAVRVDKLIQNANLHARGFDVFKEAVDKEILSTMNEAYTSSSRSLLDLVADQISYTYQNIDNVVGKIWKTEKPTRRIAEDVVLNKPLYNDTTLEQGWGGVGNAEKKRLESVIRKGIADGKTSDQIALDVRKGNVFKITKQQSQGLVITVMTSVQAQADHEVYKANDKLLLGWQYIAVLDSRTTPICSHRSGTIYPIADTKHLPPAHFYCRSTTVPVTKSWEDLGKLEGVAQIRKQNLADLTPKQIQFFDGQTPMAESYSEWLSRQATDVQLRHLGDVNKLNMFRNGQLTIDKFTNAEGNSIGIKELRQLTDPGYGVAGDTRRFALAKEKLDTIKIGAARPEDFINNPELIKSLKEYYLLQSTELDGTLSYTNYRGNLLHTKKATRQRVLSTPPTEDNLKYNPVTSRYEDTRLLPPSQYALQNSTRLINESEKLLDKDKEFIKSFVDDLELSMSVNERAVISENLRIIFTRYRDNKEIWGNFKGVVQGQIKFDIMNISDLIETQIRKDSNLLFKLKQSNYFDPVLGETQLQDLHDSFISNVFAKKRWEEKVAPKIGKKLRNVLDYKIPTKIKARLTDQDLDKFYLRFARRLSLADNPDRDQLAISLGRDLYNAANYRGSRNEWFTLGVKLLDDANNKGFYELETFGIQKRRMKSRLGGNYFGPYYDTFGVNLRIVEPRIQKYSQLTRKVDVGLRLGVTTGKNRLMIRKGYKTYFDRWYRDTGIPITSTSSFSDFPEDLIDRNMEQALNWTANAKYKVDPEFHDFIEKLLLFEDDKGKAKYYNDLNHYREYIVERGDAYERFKAMKWLRKQDIGFSNHPFLDHRARIYERGMIGPQSGETFRPFLNTEEAKNFSAEGFDNLQDQIGAFLGGLNDKFEGRYNSLSFTGRQKIAETWRKDLVDIGNTMRRGKPNDIRKILDSQFVQNIDGEEQGKALRFALEMSKIDEFLKGNYSNLDKLKDYKISLALEQDASSSGAQIIALTTKNKQLAELSNVVPTKQKQRLYDEIAASTFNDPRFRELNLRLGLTEKDLRKASKAQNMVTFYGAGERTGILNVESKLAKILGKTENTLVVKAKDRDTVLSEISARAARYKSFDIDTYNELMALRKDVKDIFNAGEQVGDDIMQQLYFLDPKTKDLVEKMTRQYTNVVSPDDFKLIASIMSENLRVQVPILKDFTKYFGRLAEDFVVNAKPSDSRFDLSKFLQQQITGKEPPKLPKKWTQVPWVNFDGKTVEQHFTQVFEERLRYKDKDGNWVVNILQVPQKTDPTWWEEFTNKEGKINDIVDAQKARTAFAVNGNHSNDAVIVKQFHLWGRKKGIQTSTVHDAFFANSQDMIEARAALKNIYADMLDANVIKNTLDEMYKRGLPRSLYVKYLKEAIDIGLIPIAGKSVVGGKTLTKQDILTKADILQEVPKGFKKDLGWYGIG
jgi:SPP1 gp7 family putative phage head morphogenesis protein